MNKDPIEQLAFDFTSASTALAELASSGVAPRLSLVHSNSHPDASGLRNEAAERERILAKVASYAQRLSW